MYLNVYQMGEGMVYGGLPFPGTGWLVLDVGLPVPDVRNGWGYKGKISNLWTEERSPYLDREYGKLVVGRPITEESDRRMFGMYCIAIEYCSVRNLRPFPMECIIFCLTLGDEYTVDKRNLAM